MAGTSTEWKKPAEPAEALEDTASGERTPMPAEPAEAVLSEAVRAEAETVRVASADSGSEHIDDEVWEYLQGECTEARLAQIDAHLDGCESCRELLHHLLQGQAATGQRVPPGELEACFTSFSPGTVVNSRFVIRHFVGKGGMGEVYEALDRLTNTRIALKTILCSVEDRSRAARRLTGEVLNAQRVGHPHVCRINELHEHTDGLTGSPIPFFTMEFIDGVRLSQRIRNGRLALAETRVLARQLISGLAAAHSRGVLHLDLKSDNVMLRSVSGQSAGGKGQCDAGGKGDAAPDAVIMDFGLSRLLEKGAKQHTSERHQIVGTLPYMSLEQLECRDNWGPAADIYSFGVVLYEMLTGAFPFRSDTLRSLIAGQINSRPDAPSKRTPGLSAALDHFVLKCLSREPTARYADANAALLAFDAIGAWEVPVRDARWRQRRIVAAVAGLGLLGALALAAQRGAAPQSTLTQLRPEVAPASVQPMPIQPMPTPAVEAPLLPPAILALPTSRETREAGGAGLTRGAPASSKTSASAARSSSATTSAQRAASPRPRAEPAERAAAADATLAPSSSPIGVVAAAPEHTWPAGVPQRLLARPKPLPAAAQLTQPSSDSAEQ